ncbi:M4 family metallopeptidase [Ideonella margarita]|uniref:Neutral metalloproteinase n=1 Tax=Ideonella margarita TaxID=2984191 RepID=A0ABU9C942_9BURK
MTRFPLRAAALAALLACTSGLALAAKPADDHPAVQRALAQLSAAASSDARVSSADAFSPVDLVVDADGTEHVRLNRSHQGLRVIGGDVVVHSAAGGRLIDVSRQQAQVLTLSVKPTVKADAAAKSALAKFGHFDGQIVGKELVIHARTADARLAWDVQVHGVRADGTPSEAHLLIDARTGALIDRWDDIHTADAVGTGSTLYSGVVPLHGNLNNKGTKYSLEDLTRGGHTVKDMANATSGGKVMKDANNAWGNGLKTDKQTAAADAAYGQNTTWDYYLNVLGRSGIANDGKGAYSRVHYSSNYDNAFWSDACFCMTYGDGSFFNPLVSLDVAGHEMTHGVTSRTAGLIYSGESGGLNEGTSDIFGSMVEYYAANANDPGDYDIGEEISKTAGKALRYMNKPSRDGSSADCWYSGVGNIDVHYSSGVANHFFFLLAEGTAPSGLPASPTCQAGDTRVATGSGSLTGIGRDKAAKIWYRALTVYMTASETYAKARTDTLKAAVDLYGAGSTEALAVAAAWTAVNRP